MKTQYRPELDGLRAIAILFVLFDHFEIGRVDGGFAGVDIFFVLSGFLITAQCAQFGTELRWPQIRDFYVRRFWRIAPAYYAVILLTIAIGAQVMLADDMRGAGRSALASALFAANVYFNQNMGYFAASAIYSPLLHLWSLGVEAQFYLVWPLALRLALRRPTRSRLLIVAAIGLASFAVSTLLSIHDGKTAFFSLPSRLWEFCIGAGLALAPDLPSSIAARPLSKWATTAALVTLLAAPFFIDSDMLWPAPTALIVTAATAAVILGARHPASLAHRLLSLAPMVWVGRISYSLYLVHWPLLTLATYAVFPTAGLLLRAALMLASLPLAWLLYRFVEAPLRGAYRSDRRWRTALTAGMPAAALGLAGWFGVQTALPAPHEVEAPGRSLSTCRSADWGAPWPDACLMGASDAPPVAALWGDSHAGHFASGFAEAFGERREAIAAFTKPSCPPLPGLRVATNDFGGRADCEAQNARVLAYILATPSIKTVYLAGRWAAYVEAARFGKESGGRYFLIRQAQPRASVETSRELMRQALIAVSQTLSRAGKAVVLIEQTPEMGFDAGRCAELLTPAEAATRCTVPREAVMSRQRNAEAIIAAVRAVAPGLRVVDPRRVLCDADLCYAVRNGESLYGDFHHLSDEGSKWVVPLLLRQAEAN
jgi:peptidoglycan/LPS O-acetylase OafA/YrhL